MSATGEWKTIRKRRVGSDRARASRAREALEAELRLATVRKHRKASQATVAKRLAVSQSNISQLERQADPRLSTIAGYVEALGGRLEVTAVFGDERVPLK